MTTTSSGRASQSKKAAAKKKATKKKTATGKIPGMKDIVAANKAVKKKRAVWETARDQANARKKELDGAQADLNALIDDAEKGQAHLYD